MKLAVYTIAYNSLTNFEYNGKERTGNGNYGNLLKLVFEKVVKSLQPSAELIFGEFEKTFEITVPPRDLTKS